MKASRRRTSRFLPEQLVAQLPSEPFDIGACLQESVGDGLQEGRNPLDRSAKPEFGFHISRYVVSRAARAGHLTMLGGVPSRGEGSGPTRTIRVRLPSGAVHQSAIYDRGGARIGVLHDLAFGHDMQDGNAADLQRIGDHGTVASPPERFRAEQRRILLA